MAADYTLKDFLVKLGYKIDAAQEKKFITSVEGATKNIVKLGASIAATATAVTASFAKIADGLETLYYQTQRTGDSAVALQSYGQAMSMIGVNGDTARASIVNLGDKLREFPNMAGAYARLGIDVHKTNGELKGAVDIASELAPKIAEMYKQGGIGRARALRMGEMLGLDKESIMAMGLRSDEYVANLKKVENINERFGLNDQATKDAHEFMNTLRTLGVVAEAIGQKIVSALEKKFGANIENFIDLVDQHKDEIIDFVMNAAKWIGEVADKLWEAAKATSKFVDKLGGWENVFIALAALKLVSIVSNVVSLGAAIADLSTSLGGLIAISGGVGYALGTVISGALDDIISKFTGADASLGTFLYDLFNKGENSHDVKFKAKDYGSLIPANVDKKDRVRSNIQLKRIQESKDALSARATSDIANTAPGSPEAKAALRKEAARQRGGMLPQTMAGSGSKKDQIIQKLVQMGWSETDAAAIVGNLQQESGLDENINGPKTSQGNAHGIAQWLSKDRVEEFKKVIGKDLIGSTLDEQLTFMQYELTQGKYKKVGDKLRSAGTLAEKTKIFGEEYEGAGKNEMNMDRRQRLAEMALLNSQRQKESIMAHKDDIGDIGQNPQGSLAPQLNQTNTITINGATDPNVTANKVGLAMNNVNENVIRNMRGAVVA